MCSRGAGSRRAGAGQARGAAVHGHGAELGWARRAPAWDGWTQGTRCTCGTSSAWGWARCGAPSLCGAWLERTWDPSCVGQSHTGHRGPVVHDPWLDWAQGTPSCVGHGQTGHRGPVVCGTWLDWAQGTRRAWGMAGLGTRPHPAHGTHQTCGRADWAAGLGDQLHGQGARPWLRDTEPLRA